jgi:predicted transposase YdaD
MLNPLQKLLLERELAGEAKGEAKGKAEGRAEGEAKGKAETLLRVLELRFGSVPADLRHRAHHATVEQLDRWVDRALDVARVEDVFAD